MQTTSIVNVHIVIYNTRPKITYVEYAMLKFKHQENKSSLSSHCYKFSFMIVFLKKNYHREFLGSSMVRDLHFHC